MSNSGDSMAKTYHITMTDQEYIWTFMALNDALTYKERQIQKASSLYDLSTQSEDQLDNSLIRLNRLFHDLRKIREVLRALKNHQVEQEGGEE